MMKCPSKSGELEVLLDYVAGKLSDGDRGSFERHMLDCADCRLTAAAQSSVWNALSEWDEVPVSADFNRRLYAQIEAEESRQGFLAKWWHALEARWSPFSWKPAVPVAAAGATLMAALLMQSPVVTPNLPEGGKQTRLEKVDVEQVEKTLDDIDMLKQLSTINADGDTSGS